jgi:hypothetical protein
VAGHDGRHSWEIARLRRAYNTLSNEVEQILGKALHYPAYGLEMFEDGQPDGSVCVGDEVPQSLAFQAADELDRLRRNLDTALGEQQRLRNVWGYAEGDVRRLHGLLTQVLAEDLWVYQGHGMHRTGEVGADVLQSWRKEADTPMRSQRAPRPISRACVARVTQTYTEPHQGQ